MEALKMTISNLLGLRIDYYVLVDMAGFVALVDALGGVDVYFDEPMHIAFSAAVEDGDKAFINVEAGVNHLSGLEALAYVRNRYRSSDYVRMQRQRCMLRSIAAEADIFTLMRKFPAIAEALSGSTRTDIPVGLLPELIRQVSRLDFSEIDTIAFQPGYYAPDRDFGRYPIPDPERIQDKVRDMLAASSDPSSPGVVESECD
jgi:anionic cell wall polymer biosynthesis LytR-Cps2A-Psr (LCP) family protein